MSYNREREIQCCKSTESYSLSISDRTFKNTHTHTQTQHQDPEKERKKKMAALKWHLCPSLFPFESRQRHRHNGRRRRTPLEFEAPGRGVTGGSESNRVGAHFDGEVQAYVAGEASDLEVAVHHNTSGAESDVVFRVPSSSFQHEGEFALCFFFFFSFGSNWSV